MPRRVVSADGLSLAVERAGSRAAPTVVCVHGYPDNRAVWAPVVAELVDRYDIITYDVRGAGDSEAPRSRRGYHLDRLAEDLAAVIDAVSPERPVHLLAHDWGSIQTWHAITGGWLSGRVASFTSISGPSLDHAGAWLRSRTRPNPRALRDLGVQLLRSTYIGFFQLPVLPELAWCSGLLTRLMRRLDDTAEAPAFADARRGLALYRQNMPRRLSRPRPLRADVPVQVLAPSDDAFVGPKLQTEIGTWVADLRVHHIKSGHWLPRSRPDIVAGRAAELIDSVENRQPARDFRT